MDCGTYVAWILSPYPYVHQNLPRGASHAMHVNYANSTSCTPLFIEYEWIHTRDAGNDLMH